jgi:murein DD-endopeptidase MepM/ murein hydrolase activator NlpD
MPQLFFPAPEWNKQAYNLGMRQFGWNRGKRKHAGCDVYARLGSMVVAIADGTVVENNSFYARTNQLSVFHPGIGVVRYGEIVNIPPKFAIGSPVIAGETVGEIGHLYGLKVHPMLHFELYDGTGVGSLSLAPAAADPTYSNVPQARYRRRADLMDPTALLDRLAALLPK